MSKCARFFSSGQTGGGNTAGVMTVTMETAIREIKASDHLRHRVVRITGESLLNGD